MQGRDLLPVSLLCKSFPICESHSSLGAGLPTFSRAVLGLPSLCSKGILRQKSDMNTDRQVMHEEVDPAEGCCNCSEIRSSSVIRSSRDAVSPAEDLLAGFRSVSGRSELLEGLMSAAASCFTWPAGNMRSRSELCRKGCEGRNSLSNWKAPVLSLSLSKQSVWPTEDSMETS